MDEVLAKSFYNPEECQSPQKAFGTFGVLMGPSCASALSQSIRVPSLAMPTSAKHDPAGGSEGPPMPAEILLFSRPLDDRKLIQVGMALDVALSPPVNGGEVPWCPGGADEVPPPPSSSPISQLALAAADLQARGWLWRRWAGPG